jgi:hypothetical protein
MQLQQTQKSSAPLPFALKNHEPVMVKTLLGRTEQEWSWKPVGDFKTEDLSIYASGGTSTTRQTMTNQWDSGEFQ